MSNPHNRPKKHPQRPESKSANRTEIAGHITRQIQTTLKEIKDEEGLRAYPIRLMVNHAQEFGPYLKQQRLETNQVRKFLDALNRIKVKLSQEETGKIEAEQVKNKTTPLAATLETDIVLLKPKLAYAAARQKAAEPLSSVMSSAIDKVHCVEDFQRLIQFIESIIAYHKAEGGK